MKIEVLKTIYLILMIISTILMFTTIYPLIVAACCLITAIIGSIGSSINETWPNKWMVHERIYMNNKIYTIKKYNYYEKS